jgi:hypothetical protein
MRLHQCTIERFKRFRPPGLTVAFHDAETNAVADRYLVLGENAAGKTTILQAIALTLSLAQRSTTDAEHFAWTGWVGNRLHVHGAPRVEIHVEFDEEEVEATRAVLDAHTAHTGQSTGGRQWPASRMVWVRLEGGRVSTPNHPDELFLFQGRTLLAGLMRHRPDLRRHYAKLPGVFWYDQYRNVAVPGARDPDARAEAHPDRADHEPVYRDGVARLDALLKAWYGTRPGHGLAAGHDYLGDLEALYGLAFPGRSFSGVEPVYGNGPTPIGDRFVLSDGVHTYALSEMSAGEQAVFPLLFEFVRQQIHKSVVLIDELDLNLHPPLAQALYELLPRLGHDNQFILTTHSPAVAALVARPATLHLPDGRGPTT